MKCRYDFHIHSCLSPCADDEMTPCNIANMAALLELDIIALTDHNSTANCRAALEAGRDAGILVIPGMELCTAEEIHAVCLFPDLTAADAFGGMVRESLQAFRNKPEVFGNQIIMDSRDGVLGAEDILLSNASSISIDSLPALVKEYGGVCYPAHIDRPSYSILAVFGMIGAYMGFSCAELTRNANPSALLEEHPALRDMRLLCSSDSHALEMLAAAEPHTLELPELSAKAVIEALASLR